MLYAVRFQSPRYATCTFIKATCVRIPRLIVTKQPEERPNVVLLERCMKVSSQ